MWAAILDIWANMLIDMLINAFNEFSDPENIGFEPKIKMLHQVQLAILAFIYFNDGHLEKWPPDLANHNNFALPLLTSF
jgi:hypothetical protein